jgi:hypothetical protein
MPFRPEVRDAQRTLATLDAVHLRAASRLNQVLARRAELIAQQDDHVATAQSELDKAVVAMASEVSVELAAHLLDLDVADVRRLVKAGSAVGTHRPNANGSIK